MTHVIVAVLLATLAASGQDTKKIPDDSVEVETRGCLKGRVFTATSAPEDEGTSRGPNVVGRNFRLAGDRALMDQVKTYDRQWVQIVGIVRKADLADGIGMRVGGGRVAIGPGPDPMRGAPRTAGGGIPVMDLTSVRLLADRCPIQ